MNTENKPPQEKFPTDPDTLKKIYLEGFNAGFKGSRPEENPYPFSFGYNRGEFSPFVYNAKWANGRADGQNVSKENPNLSEDQKWGKIKKLREEFPNDPTIQNL